MNIQSLAGSIPVEGQHSIEGIDFITNGDQYLTFMLDKEQYAVDILCVEEIRGWEPPTTIPNSPEYVKGVINMRGIIVPIIDLRLKFNIGKPLYSKVTVVIVLTFEGDNKARTIGFVVDAVSDVLNADLKDIQSSPAFGGCIPQQYIEGLINVGRNVVTLLNVENLQMLEQHHLDNS